jgi:alkyldihydroxyacetonephosphate synthase
MLQEARGAAVAPPVAVVFPASTEEVSVVLAWAAETGTPVVPRGAGSGRSGGAQAVKRSVVVDVGRMNRVLEVDETSQTVRVEAGVRGSMVEIALARRGLTVGHEPVSMDISTVGGWIASSAAGVAQAGYGSIEDSLLGLTAVLPGGATLTLPAVPRSAAGPDLRRLLVGSEGILGIVTEATLSVARAAALGWEAFRPHSFESGLALLRELVQRPFRPLVTRLFDEARASELFGAFGHRGGPVLVVGFDTSAPAMEAERFEVARLARDLGARAVSRDLAEFWWDHRFDPIDWYESVMGPERSLGPGVVADTVEVAALWRRLPTVHDEIRGTLLDHAESVGCVVGHVHVSGASLLFPFVLRAADDGEAERAYVEAWREVFAACERAGATTTYHHGVGLLRTPFLAQEVGSAGVDALRRVKRAFDPQGTMNPGKLLPPEPPPT